MNKKKMMGVFVCILCVCAGIHFYFMAHPVVLNNKSVSIEINDTYNYKDNIKFVYMGESKDVSISPKIDTSKVADYTIEYRYKKTKTNCTIHIVDTTPPELTLKDYTTDMVEECKPEFFVEECKDNSKYTLSIETENISEEGETEVSIKAEDEYGNQITKTSTLIRKVDTTPPVLGDVKETVHTKQGTKIPYKKISVTDDFDPEPQLDIEGEVDFDTPGTYTVKYTASDRSGNITKMERNIIVDEIPESEMKVVYLTFDDGPSDNTEKILKILDKYDAKATFFVTGHGQAYNDCILKAYQSGHAIGLHTYTHDYESVYSSTKAYYKDLDAIGQMVSDIIGFKPNIIRFPGGSSNTISANYKEGIMTKLTKSVVKNGYQYYDWNCDSTDASGYGVDPDILVENATSGKGKHIMILFHDTFGKETTVDALPRVIKYYKNKGYTFKPITKENSMICHHGVNN